MADELVKRAQQFINRYDVAGIPKVTVDGITGWATMRALTRILQYELGITSLSDNFGPTTLSLLEERLPAINSTLRSAAIARVIQSGLYCKGFDGGEIDGTYNERVVAAVKKLKSAMGVSDSYPEGTLTPKVFKALLTMDAYVLMEGGDPQIQAAQRWLNGRYWTRRDFFVGPCDGLFLRDTQKSLMLGVQFELGIADGDANGVLGPTTKDLLSQHVLKVGATGPFVSLFTIALCANRRSGATFTPDFTSQTAVVVRSFQAFAKLKATSKADFPTWASLLVSTGDRTRPANACDCVTEVTEERAATLARSGFKYVGRYLSNVPGSSLNKMIQAGELETIGSAGLRVFPIYQTRGGEAGYFHDRQGAADAFSAIEWARFHGFKSGTRIFFAVDFDALDKDVTDAVLPHFRSIKRVMDENGKYKVGIYGARNVCSRVAAEGLTSASFVLDMSTGYSGNLGYPLPADWAYDQIDTISIGSGAGALQVDKNVASGRDVGQSTFSPGAVVDGLDVDLPASRHSELVADIKSAMELLGYPEKGMPNIPDLPLSSTPWPNSTTESTQVVLASDALLTGIARTLRMRKALIAVPLFWEFRNFNQLDIAADAGVVAYHKGGGIPGDPFVKRDCSTGLGQIKAATAIDSRNYCARSRIIVAAQMDPDDDQDVWDVWSRLHSDNSFNITTIAHVLIRAANLEKLARPSLTSSEEEARLCIRRYQGSGAVAEADSVKKLTIYRVFESHYSRARNS